MFVTPFNWKKKSLWDVFGMLRTPRSVLKFSGVSDNTSLIKSRPVDVSLKMPHNEDSASTFSWLGHATCLYRVDGVSFITDPVFSLRCSPSQWVGPKRFIPAPCAVEDLHVDIVLLSHTHYDHLDAASAASLGNRPLWIVPLGVASWLASVGITRVVELDWWETYVHTSATGKSFRIVFTPANHWTNRGLFDTNTALWGSYVVVADSCTPKKSFYFSGDTAYDSKLFKHIGRKYGPFDIASIGIGAYKPRPFMRDNHVNPRESVQIHQDIGSKMSCGIHWGTFPMSYEDVVEPAFDLAYAREMQRLTHESVFTMEHGETVVWAGPESAPRTAGMSDIAFSHPELMAEFLAMPREAESDD